MLAEVMIVWLMVQPHAPPAVLFRPAQREVSNWRTEAALALDFNPVDTARILVGFNPGGISRCVRLNNYWCIKRAGWAGEIAADSEGHVAFASAQEGALVAAVLLKRYYVDFKRHSAMDIVARWAPAQCGGGGGNGRPAGVNIARRGLGNTLRARFLAHRRGGAPLRQSIIADRPLPQLRVASIAVGVGGTPGPLPSLALGSVTGAADFKLPPLRTCGGDNVRIANYARRASAGIASETTDLKLFSSDGLPTDNLARLMLNMASVEIGPLATRQTLVEAAVTALTERLKAQQGLGEPHF